MSGYKYEHNINIKKLLFSLAICQLTGLLGGLFTYSAINSWYPILVKPSFVPPNWAFSVVWPLLYLLMGVAFYIIWIRGMQSPEVKKAISVFSFQLFLNLLWSVLFFWLRSPLLGLIEIVCLWLMILATIFSFFKISRNAGILLVPYLIWVSFAAWLNYSIWVLNS